MNHLSVENILKFLLDQVKYPEQGYWWAGCHYVTGHKSVTLDDGMRMLLDDWLDGRAKWVDNKCKSSTILSGDHWQDIPGLPKSASLFLGLRKDGTWVLQISNKIKSGKSAPTSV